MADHNDILHTSRQCHCRDVCKISLWSVEYIRNYSVLNFYRISNSIEICLVGQAPGLCRFHLWVPDLQMSSSDLTHLPLVLHICISECGKHWFRKWLVAYSATSHYLNQCWVIINWTIGNRLQWNFNQNTRLFIHESAPENIVCKMAAIF